MSLTCGYDFEPEPGQVCYESGRHPIEPCPRLRSTKCTSCGARIAPGDQSMQFRRWKVPEYDIEYAIYGDDCWQGPPRAPYWLCLGCANIYLFLDAFNYNVDVNDNMHDLAAEHAAMVKAGIGGC